jgi:hypothetical protein
MGDAIAVYFGGEKQAGALCLALGVLAAAFALWVWRGNVPFRMMAAPVGLIALLQLGIGVGLLARTDRQVATLRADLAADPPGARAAERARMERVNTNFKVVEWVEVGLVLAGLALLLGFRARPALAAVGMGLCVQAAVMLAFDVFAEERARAYTEFLDAK